jgi:hypothetical protein
VEYPVPAMICCIGEVVEIGHFPKKAQNLCDVTQYAYAECQVTKQIYTLAINLFILKCQYLNGNNSVISASVNFFPFWNEMDS